MIELHVVDNKIDVRGYGAKDSLGQLIRAVETFRLEKELKTRYCDECGECCNQPIPVLGCDFTGLPRAAMGFLTLPPAPTPEERRKGIRDLMLQNELTEGEATLLYEYNRAEPITLPRKADGTCFFLDRKRCSIYRQRPFMCRLFLCNMGERLSVLYEMIIGQGIWHAYSRMGWIDVKELGHNPFLHRGSNSQRNPLDEVRLSDFDFNLEAARDRLFFYF